MLNKKIIVGALGAAAIVATSAIAFATTDAAFDIVTSESSIRIGSTTFQIGAGTLFGNVGTDEAGVCAFGIDAARSNPTLKPVTITLGVQARLELCENVSGNLTDTTADGTGTITTTNTRIKVKLSGLVNCEIPCVPINFSSSPLLSSDAQDYSTEDGTVKLVDETFAVDASASCPGFINTLLGLPSKAGKNSAVLSLKTAAPPTCAAPPAPPEPGDSSSESATAPTALR